MRKLLLVTLVAGCASEARLPASYFAEGGNVLAPGQVAVTGVAGGGATLDGKAVGAGGRVRVGVGDGQEVGIEAAGMVMDSPGEQCFIDCEGYPDTRVTVQQRSALLSWKSQLRPELAVIVGVGASEHKNVGGDPRSGQDDHGSSYDGTIAVVRSLRLTETMDFYGGARASFALPTSKDVATSEKATSVIGVSSALGLDMRLSPHVHGYLEAGPRGSVIFNEGPTFGFSAVAGLGLTL
jgi:hypothetical protein